MDLFKRNPVFFGLCIASLLMFIGASAFIFVESRKLSKSKEQVANADGQIRAIMYATPAPTNENVKAAQKNVEELNERLINIYKELQQGSYFNTTDDGVSAISNILRYISDYQKRVANHLDDNSVPAPIQVPDRFAFGFDKYFDSTVIPEGELVPKLDKQRQILSYILDRLIAAHPTSIQAVEREGLYGMANKNPGFTIDPAITARVPNAINTLAFRVTFTGYTPTLRKFLNSLAYFKLPIVVRSVEVDRLESKSQQNASDIFNARNNGNMNKTPVISEIESIFTVTLEFIEVIVPPDIEEDLS